jgi:hypothetical protein
LGLTSWLAPLPARSTEGSIAGAGIVGAGITGELCITGSPRASTAGSPPFPVGVFGAGLCALDGAVAGVIEGDEFACPGTSLGAEAAVGGIDDLTPSEPAGRWPIGGESFFSKEGATPMPWSLAPWPDGLTEGVDASESLTAAADRFSKGSLIPSRRSNLRSFGRSDKSTTSACPGGTGGGEIPGCRTSAW